MSCLNKLSSIGGRIHWKILASRLVTILDTEGAIGEGPYACTAYTIGIANIKYLFKIMLFQMKRKYLFPV